MFSIPFVDPFHAIERECVLRQARQEAIRRHRFYEQTEQEKRSRHHMRPYEYDSWHKYRTCDYVASYSESDGDMDHNEQPRLIPISSSPTVKHQLKLQAQNHAASIIQRAFRTHQLRIEMKKVVCKLTKLKELECSVRALERQHNYVWSKPLVFEDNRVSYRESKDFLSFEDGLLRIMLAVDGVDASGDGVVRYRRKALVAHIQGLLDHMDRYREEQWILATRECSSSTSDLSSVSWESEGVDDIASDAPGEEELFLQQLIGHQ